MSEQLPEPQLVNTGDIDNPVPISQAILDGYAPGNELYNYAKYPEISHQELTELKNKNFPVIFYAATKKLLGSAIPNEVLKATAKEVYSSDNFDLDDDDNLRFNTLSSGIHVVGLSDGPTAAFKDMAMQPFAKWMSYLLQQKGEPLTILLSTSGDTGPAALHAFGGRPNIEIAGMMPKKGVSRFQWAQMAELAEQSGVHVLEVTGDFSYINDLHMEADLAYDLGAVNSVNIARIIAQVAYQVAAYLKTVELEDKQVGDPVDVSIPSGNFGNALSAIIARKMGLPYRNIIVATNENNTLDILFREGVFRRLDKIKHTNSSAQDVRMPSNVLRYFGMLFENDTEKYKRLFQTWEKLGAVTLNDIGIVDQSLRQGVLSATVKTADRARVIRSVYTQSGAQRTIIDPHTANGLAAIEILSARDPDVPMLAMETAKPFKFNGAMKKILGIIPPRPERFRGLEQRQSGKILTQIANKSDLLTYLGEHTPARPKQASGNGDTR